MTRLAAKIGLRQQQKANLHTYSQGSLGNIQQFPHWGVFQGFTVLAATTVSSLTYATFSQDTVTARVGISTSLGATPNDVVFLGSALFTEVSTNPFVWSLQTAALSAPVSLVPGTQYFLASVTQPSAGSPTFSDGVYSSPDLGNINTIDFPYYANTPTDAWAQIGVARYFHFDLS